MQNFIIISGEVEEKEIPIGEADVKKPGEDLTVVAISRVVHEALEAAEELEEQNDISVEIIDPRSLKPLDMETILDSVEKTGNILVATDEYKYSNVASEIISQITQ